MNARLGEIARGLAMAMVLPVVFKLLDFIFLFRGRTVTTFFILWLVGTLAWVVSRLRGSSPIADVAAHVDRKAGLNDQLKTAYWFIRNPRSSEWIEAQIQRAAKETSNVRLDNIFPRIVPRTSYIAGALLFLLIALNFVPLSLNYNWVYLQAAPAFRLSDNERISLENALKLLQKAKAAENAKVAEKIEELIKDLEQGNISLEDAIQQLEDLQNQLEEGEAEAGVTANGIQQMASILKQAKALQQAAGTLGQGKLDEAANQLRDLGERLPSVSAEEMQDMAQRLNEASENPRGSLQELARAFENTSSAIKKGDRAASKSGLEKIASELEKIKQRIDQQELVADASQELGDLVDSLQQREKQDGDASAGEPGKPGENKGKGEGESKAGERGGQGEAKQSGGEPNENGEPGDGQDGGETQEAGQNPGAPSADSPNGKGGNSFGGSTKSAPLEGDATSLEVQLQQEALKMDTAAGGSDPDKKNQAAGEQERSKLDYRNAPSDLTPAQKDLLNQDHIPWESRQLIKNYFQAVKPKQTK